MFSSFFKKPSVMCLLYTVRTYIESLNLLKCAYNTELIDIKVVPAHIKISKKDSL